MPDDSSSTRVNPFIQLAESRGSGTGSGLLIILGAMVGTYYFWQEITIRNLDNNGNLVFASIGTVILVTLYYLGARIIIKSTHIRTEVIPPEDRAMLVPLIENAETNAITEYIRLSSLSGATGTATKLGLTGLPLLTVALTLIFSGLALIKPEGGFMDLAKLTLGAFIGSFVQRTASNQAVVDAVTKPKASPKP